MPPMWIPTRALIPDEGEDVLLKLKLDGELITALGARQRQHFFTGHGMHSHLDTPYWTPLPRDHEWIPITSGHPGTGVDILVRVRHERRLAMIMGQQSGNDFVANGFHCPMRSIHSWWIIPPRTNLILPKELVCE